MDKKKKHKKNPSPEKVLRFLPLLGLTACLFIVLAGLLLCIGRIDKTVSAWGVFEPYPKIEIKAAIKDTVVDSILAEPGKEVKKEEVLMQLKDQEQTYEKIAQLKERLKLAGADLEKLTWLFDKGYVADRDRQEAELKMKILTQDLKALQKRMEALMITAPFTGTVAGIPVNIGDAVNMGQELVLLACSEERALRIWIKEKDSSEVEIGQKVRIYSQIFYYRRHGIASGSITEIERYPRLKDGGNHIEALVRITESPFPVRVGSRAEAKIIISRPPVLKLLFGLEP